jgi:hypothetical protein
VPFTSHAADGGAEAFSATIEVADFDLYKNLNATQRTSTSGFTLAESFDGLTGSHTISFDFSDNTDAGFYTDAGGAFIHAVFSPDETLDSQVVVKQWSCEIMSLPQDAQRLYADSIYPLGCTISTTTGNTASRMNLTDLLDAQVADGDLVGSTWDVWDATNGQWNRVTIVSVESARLFNVVLTADGSVMDFTVAAGDRAWFVGWEALRATVPGQTTDAAILQRALTEAYSTDGGTVTISQALYELIALLQEFSVSGTTLTVKKRDGSTTAFTCTLSDATNPTSITRAT